MPAAVSSTQRSAYQSSERGTSTFCQAPSTQRQSGCSRMEQTTSRPSRMTWMTEASGKRSRIQSRWRMFWGVFSAQRALPVSARARAAKASMKPACDEAAPRMASSSSRGMA